MARPDGLIGGRPALSATLKIAACGLLLLALPACGIPSRRHAQPAPALPPSFAGVTSPENSSQLGIDEFYKDPILLGLIHQAFESNRELKILNEEVQVASSEILARSGAYLPFITAGPEVGLDRPSNRTIEGAAIRDDEYLPGKFFSNPHGNYLAGANFTWQIDIYRQLRNARDAAARRYVAAIERRNFFVTQMVADIAENYFRLMALDKRIENLDQIIAFQEQSLKVAEARKEAARDTELAVLRFQAEVRRNQSEKLIVYQDIIEVENRINVLLYRYPQAVQRDSSMFYDLYINSLNVGMPSQLLQNRPDIRQAERELDAAGLDVEVARANFFPQLILNAGVGLQSFNISDLFIPQAVVGNIAAGFIGPLVNRRAIRGEYLSSNARQVQAIYNYQRTVLNAFTEVVNRLTEVQNYSNSVLVKKQQLAALESAVDVANQLFQFARTEYLDVLTAQRDLRDARTSLIDTKERQLSAIVNAYQTLGGGALLSMADQEKMLRPIPLVHDVLQDKDFWALSQFHYGAGRFFKALRASLEGVVPYHNQPVMAPMVMPAGPPIAPSLNEAPPLPMLPTPALAPDENATETPLPPALGPLPPTTGDPSPFGGNASKPSDTDAPASTSDAPSASDDPEPDETP